ncbi:hypothetical protein L0Y46_04305, partial [bacterium]|nr:hypothetical protein [bacterium]
TDFSDPLKTVYSWNRSLKESRDAFLAQDLAVYFGFASELSSLRSKNPNLDFDVAPVPQVRDHPFRSTLAHMNATAVMKTSKQKPLAFFVASLLTSQEISKIISSEMRLPPVRRDLLSAKPTDAFMNVFYDSALISKSWFDPNPKESNRIFQTAVVSVVTGTASVDGAIGRADAEINLLQAVR